MSIVAVALQRVSAAGSNVGKGRATPLLVGRALSGSHAKEFAKSGDACFVEAAAG